MEFDSIKSLFESFDIAAFLPDLTKFIGWVELALRLAVMAGPLLLLGFGLLYLLAPPKEANYRIGYRFYWSMASLDAWQFTHRLVGMAWSGLGLLLTVIMALICNGFRRMEPMDMVWCAVSCLIWELVLVALSCLVIDVVVIAVFDKDGFRRSDYEEE
ncbi:MAG: SdpI family protein [Oscillospiraceae bacterium]|nr:SdpI family protein [Oscillospiraceae bacterium]